jgi:hypothetical protein
MDASAEVQAESRALDATLLALKDLVNQPASDLRPQYNRYSATLDRLVSAAQRTQNTGRKMCERSAVYFDAWDKQLATIDYELIRNLSETRRSEVTNRVQTIQRRYQESKAVVHPW